MENLITEGSFAETSKAWSANARDAIFSGGDALGGNTRPHTEHDG